MVKKIEVKTGASGLVTDANDLDNVNALQVARNVAYPEPNVKETRQGFENFEYAQNGVYDSDNNQGYVQPIYSEDITVTTPRYITKVFENTVNKTREGIEEVSTPLAIAASNEFTPSPNIVLSDYDLKQFWLGWFSNFVKYEGVLDDGNTVIYSTLNNQSGSWENMFGDYVQTSPTPDYEALPFGMKFDLPIYRHSGRIAQPSHAQFYGGFLNTKDTVINTAYVKGDGATVKYAGASPAKFCYAEKLYQDAGDTGFLRESNYGVSSVAYTYTHYDYHEDIAHPEYYIDPYFEERQRTIEGVPAEPFIFVTDVLPAVATASNSSGTGTIVTESAHGLTTGDYIYIDSANSSTTDLWVGRYQVTVTDTVTFTITVNASASSSATNVKWSRYHDLTVFLNTTKFGSVFENLNLMKVYRTPVLEVTTAQGASDPGVDFRFVKEVYEAELTAVSGFSSEGSFTDETSDFSLGAPLYTNNNGGVGYFPPFPCAEMVVWNNRLWQGNVRYNPVGVFGLTTSSALPITSWDGDVFTIYKVFPEPATAAQLSRSGTTATMVTATPHGFQTGDLITIHAANGSTSDGWTLMIKRQITVVNDTEFAFTCNGTETSPVYYVDYTMRRGEDYTFTTAASDQSTKMVHLETTGSPSENLEGSVRELVRVINAASDFARASYTSTFDGLPGDFAVWVDGEKAEFVGPTAAIQRNYDDVAWANKGTHVVTYSDVQQPEHFPLNNQILTGSPDDEVMRLVPTEDKLFVFKKNSYGFISGSSNFAYTQVAENWGTVAPRTIVNLDDRIYGLTPQGMVMLWPQINPIDSNINEVIQDAVVRRKTFDLAHAFVDPIKHEIYLTVPADNTETPDLTTYVYNTVSNIWTVMDFYDRDTTMSANLTAGGYLPYTRDLMIAQKAGTSARTLLRRDTSTVADFKDEFYEVFSLDYSSAAANTVTVNTTPWSDWRVLETGWLVEQISIDQHDYGTVLSKGVITAIAGTTWTIDVETGDFSANYSITTALRVYPPINMVAELFPFTAGTAGLLKTYDEVKVMLRNNLVTEFKIDFRSDLSPTEETITMNLSTTGGTDIGDTVSTESTLVPPQKQACNALYVGLRHGQAEIPFTWLQTNISVEVENNPVVR